MKTYTFEKAFSQGWVKIEVGALSYKDALDRLIFQVGSQAAAEKYTFVCAK